MFDVHQVRKLALLDLVRSVSQLVIQLVSKSVIQSFS